MIFAVSLYLPIIFTNVPGAATNRRRWFAVASCNLSRASDALSLQLPR